MESAKQSSDVACRSIQVRLWDAVVNISGNDHGQVVLTSDRADVMGALDRFVHEELLFPVWSLGDMLRVAARIKQKFPAEILDVEHVKSNIRNGWRRLLKKHLLGDPAQTYGERMDSFLTPGRLSVTIEATPHHVLHCGGGPHHAIFDLSDPDYLIVRPSHAKRWRAKWEKLTRISFCYLEPPSDALFKLGQEALQSIGAD